MRYAPFMAVILAVAGGCEFSGARARSSSADEAPQAPGNQGQDAGLTGGAPYMTCTIDADCEPVASSCCECPTFAMSSGSGFGGACEDVDNECSALECPATEAVCSPSGLCELVCAPVICELSCENGFQTDEAGCAVCACNAEPDPAQGAECESAEDCVQVPGDCCGCARGGTDVAVPGDSAESAIAELGCTGAEACPEVYVCDPDDAPVCVFGRCGLVGSPPAGVSEPEVCGSAESPTCPSNYDCVLNPRDYPTAAEAGLGLCISSL